MTSKIRSRKDLKDKLLQRGEEQYERKDDSGRFGTIFRKDLSGIKFWKCGEGEHTIDILPWLCGDKYPTKNYDSNPGDPFYLLDIWVHYNIGPDEDTVVCPSKNYGLPCPICEHVNDLRKEEDPDKELIGDLKARRRAIYWIICYDTAAEEEKGPQIWDVAYFFMEKHLAEISRKPRGGGFIPFSDPDDGKTVYFRRKGTGQTTTEYTAHQFLDRDYIIADEDLEAITAIDEMVVIHTYDELNQMHWGSEGGQPAEREEERPPARTRRAPVTSDKPVEEQPAEQPATRPTRRRSMVKQEEEPASQKEEPTPAGNGECPAGGVFGEDTDKLEACDSCKKWDDCAVEKTRRTESKSNNGGSTRRRRPV